MIATNAIAGGNWHVVNVTERDIFTNVTLGCGMSIGSTQYLQVTIADTDSTTHLLQMAPGCAEVRELDSIETCRSALCGRCDPIRKNKAGAS